MFKLSLLFSLILLLNEHSNAETYKVSSSIEFQNLSSRLQPGDEVIIAEGNYQSWSVEVKSNGNASNPITIRGEGNSATIFSGSFTKCVFKISGNFVELENLSFRNCLLTKADGSNGTLIDLSGVSHCRIKNCTFYDNQSQIQFLPLIIISGTGRSNTIEKCIFIHNINTIDVQVKITDKETPSYTSISGNIFKNKPKVTWTNGNGGECIQIGQDPILLGKKEAFSTIKNNSFLRCDGENEIISNKSSANSYLNNRFESNDGELVLRGGHDCIVDGNVFNGGTGGIRINGTGHKIINNKLSGIKTAIRLMYGMAKGKAETGFYIAASDCLVSGNKISKANIGIFEGDSKNVDWTGKFDTKRYPSRVLQDVAPFDNMFLNNTYKNVITDFLKE